MEQLWSGAHPHARRRPCILSVFGTRPEAIKMAPVVKALDAAGLEAPVCLSGQHRHMADQVTGLFGIRPMANLQVMRPGQGPDGVTTAVINGLGPVLADLRPDCVLVHGDTATTLGAAMAAFYARVPLAHVEAGLRTHDMDQPWPEEMNRRVTATLAGLHFAPTPGAAANLVAEGVAPGAIEVTGNTGIDALLWTRAQALTRPGTERAMQAAFPWTRESGAGQGTEQKAGSRRRMVLVTGHRRENLSRGLAGLVQALGRLAARGDVDIVWPLHPNPAVRAATAPLAERAGVHLIGPQDYAPFVWLMAQSHLILTDSGGIQEEAPALGVPVLVTRTVTERGEALSAGTARLVGTDPDRIVAEATRLLDDPAAHGAMARATNPYGDGQAAGRIAKRLRVTFGEGADVVPLQAAS